MSPIDDDGYLFGRVNVIDAAVVLVVLVALVAGTFFLVNPLASQGEPATQYATIDLGEQPRAIADRVAVGDVSPGETSATNLTITDTYVGPAGPGNATVVVRARIDGTVADDGDDSGLAFRGRTLQRGDDLDVETDSYDVEGRILELASENRTLSTGSLSVLIETNVTAATAAQIDAGDAYRLDGTTVATVEETVIAPSGAAGNRTVLLGLSLSTYEDAGDTYFGDTRVAVGRDLAVRTDRYTLLGSVVQWGSTTPPGEVTNTTATVKLSAVDPDVADALESGMVERHDGRTDARITNVRSEPATVVLESDDGNIYARDHPVDRDVYLTVELRTRRTDDGLRFHARSLREGSAVSLDFGTIRTRGTVVGLGP